jgi:hypothetical protein
MQRRVDALLDEADEAVTAHEWHLVASKGRAVLAIDAENGYAADSLKMAEANGVSDVGAAPASFTEEPAAPTSAPQAAEPDSLRPGPARRLSSSRRDPPRCRGGGFVTSVARGRDEGPIDARHALVSGGAY